MARGGRSFAALMSAALLACVCAAQQPARAPSEGKPDAARTRYRVRLALDFDGRAYEGTALVRWVNRDARPASVLYFHLYPNLRAPQDPTREPTPERPAGVRVGAAEADLAPDFQAASQSPDEPSLEVVEVRARPSAQALPFTLDAGRVTMRVQLREAVAPGAASEVEIKFKGAVPEIDPDETSLTAHLIQQVGAALRDTQELRRARDTNFSSRGVMLLGAAFPLLAAREGDDWQRRVETTVGRTVHADPADFEVSVSTAEDVSVFAPGLAREEPGAVGRPRVFGGEALRTFPLLAGRSLRATEREAAGVRVRAVHTPEHERTARRVLDAAAGAVRVFAARFGRPPFRAFTIAEAPLVAGMGSAEFSGLSIIASAFYVDFDSPSMRNLPEVVREQRASVEESLEFASAHVTAHQWWGAGVGSDPAREPVVDEALANWSALQFYREAHGEERARAAADDQLRGVYEVYRTFGGEDLPADRPARDYRNTFQYAAIVSAKGALMFEALRALLGEEHFWRALRGYYERHRFANASLADLREAFADEAAGPTGRRAVLRLFSRWLSERHGDEDIAPPNPQLAAALGMSVERGVAPRDRNAFSRIGRFFWRQMTRIR